MTYQVGAANVIELLKTARVSFFRKNLNGIIFENKVFIKVIISFFLEAIVNSN